ncbi:MAG: hydrolase, partial [Sphingomonadaceae bacterium]
MSGALTPEAEAMLDKVDPDPILARTLDWAAVNSGTSNLDGLATMAGLMADTFAALPGEVRLVDPAPVKKVDAAGERVAVRHGQHLVVSVRPEAVRRVLLTGHMDTVYPADHPFQTCDWLDDERLHGPGTADMKGGLSLLLEGLKAFESTGPEIGYDVMVNSDEETGSASSAALIAELATGKIAALTYEPSLPDGSMARARPGSGNFAIVVRGLSAHAGRNPEDGRNAIVAASALAVELYAASRDGMRINPAKIDGGGPNNVVPDLAVLNVNVRPRGTQDLAEAEVLIADLVERIAKERDVAIDLTGGFGRPPKPVGAADEALFALVQRSAADLGETIGWKDTGGVCDGNNVRACGVPVVDTMGAAGANIHSPDEWMLVPSLAGRA